MKKMGVIFYIVLGIIILIFILFLIRAFSERQFDDTSPGIPCDEKLLQKADILFVIPKFNNKSISENPEWCEKILGLNKTLAMHGVRHTYHEFLEDRNEEYLQEGIEIFGECFGFKPQRFKPPQLKISINNKRVVRKSGMKLDLVLNQIFHKVYHCGDTGIWPNWLIDLF